MNNKTNTTGFTLAEVLITLGIIGVVAALTIPTLIKNYQNHEYVTALKKAYTTTNQTLKLMAQDYDCPDDLACTGLFADGTTNSTFGKTFVSYFKIAKDCATSGGSGCWPTNQTNGAYDGSSSSYTNYEWGQGYKFITMDGMSFFIENRAYLGSGYEDCKKNYSSGKLGNMSQICGRIFIDVNGPKKGPNNDGRDTFTFWITNGKGALLYPMGGMDDNYQSWWKDSSGNPRECYPGNKGGSQCAGRIIEEGWKMNY